MSSADTVESPPANLPPEQRSESPHAWWILSGAVMFFGTLVLLAAFFIEVPYFGYLPGPAFRTDEFVSIDDFEETEASGDFYLLTVVRESVTVAGYVMGSFDERVDLVPREVIIPEGQTTEDKKRADQQAMEDSQQVAVAIALDKAGYDVSFTSDGIEISEILEGSAADGFFEVGDVITHFEEELVYLAGDLVSLIRERSVGDVVGFTVLRDDEPIDLKVTLGEREPGDGAPFMGVTIFTVGSRFDFPLDVQIESQNIGGPSAGMMFTMTIIDQLSPVDMTGGRRITGTGTIESDGGVGAIGGIEQKVFGAMTVGAELMLVPERNFPAAAGVLPEDADLQLVSVSNIDEALEAVAEFAGWSTADLADGS